MQIFVKTVSGKQISVNCEPTDTIESIRQRVHEEEGIPVRDQRLIFQGKQVSSDDSRTLAELSIPDEATLHCVMLLMHRGSSGRDGSYDVAPPPGS